MTIELPPQAAQTEFNLRRFPRSPEICVEVLSPSNTEAEIKENLVP